MSVAANSGIFFIFPIIFLVLFVLHLVTCIWAYRDCLRRGKSSEYALLALLAILFFPVMGLIIYFIIRRD
jgi:hypothetical protein